MKEKNDAKNYTTILIPTLLAEKLTERIKGTEFTSLTSYVIFVLQEIISEEDNKTTNEEFSKEDEDRVKARLRSLGYLD